jgi:membrane associated rhomboid family serine protease
MSWRQQTRTVTNHLLRHILILGGCVLLLWIIEVVDWLFWGWSLDAYGIRPRTLSGLQNILWAPLLHANFTHLLANTVPFLILGWFVLLRGARDFAVTIVCSVLISGLGIWLFGGANTLHLGASGVVFGFLGALLARAYYERSAVALGLGIAALLLYGGMLAGLAPWQPGISWLGHLFGLLGGMVAAYLLTER